MGFDFIRYEVENGRARITLNRPERRNALCSGLARGRCPRDRSPAADDAALRRLAEREPETASSP